MMKKFKRLSKTLLSSVVIFQLVFATAAVPVVSYASEINEGESARQESSKEESKEEGETKPRPDGEEKPNGEEKPSEEKPQDEESSDEGSGSSSSGSRRSSAGAVRGLSTEACDINENLISNGSFENPITVGYWDIYGSIPDWTVEWMAGSGNGDDANIEIQTENLWTPYMGNQYVELDSDFDGPTGTIYNEAGSTKISQTINTIPGNTYRISFAFAARPGTDANDNHIGLYIDGVPWGTSINATGAADSDNNWFAFSHHEFEANSYTHTISFADLGDADSYGTFLDDVSVNCLGESENDGDGSITVCKVVVDAEGNVVNGEEFSEETFTIPFNTIDDVTFTAPLTFNKQFGSNNQYNAECQTFDRLPFGIYQYGQEVVSGPTDWDVTYTEGDINSPDDGYAYGAETLSDGIIDLGGENLLTEVTLFVINEEEQESCPEGVISARINFSKVANGAQVNGWRNWGTGDVQPQVFVGGNTLAHQYDDEEWFPLTNPDGSYINDAAMETWGNGDVEGLAVQRMEGKVRVVLYGFHPAVTKGEGTKGQPTGPNGPSRILEDDGPVEYAIDGASGKEFVSFGLVLSHAGFGPENSMISPYSWSNDNSNPRIHDPAINDAANPMDDRGTSNDYINQYNPRFDRMRTYDPYRVHSVLVVTTGSDGFYASYDINPDSEEDCDSEDDDPVITLPPIGCIETSVLSYDFLNLPGVTVTGGVGNVTLTVDQSGVQFGLQGEYTVTYTAIDSEGNIDEEVMLITISVDCDNGGGGGGGGNGGGSSSGSSSNRNRGEVLGANVGPACIRFTQYHDTGDTKNEVMALQIFLNEYMDADLDVNGVYDHATTAKMHDFQAKHWNQIIKPWMQDPSNIGPNTTGRFLQLSLSAANAIIDCPNEALYLEDPMIFYSITEVENQKEFSDEQIMKVVEALAEAQGVSITE